MKKLKTVRTIAIVWLTIFLMALIWFTSSALSIEAQYWGAQQIPVPTITTLRASLLVTWCGLLLTVTWLTVSAYQANRHISKTSKIIHDFRNTVTVFQLYTEMLGKDNVSEDKKQKYIATLKAETDKLRDELDKIPSDKTTT